MGARSMPGVFDYRLDLELTGFAELMERLKALPKKLERRGLKSAVNAASQIVLKSARTNAPWGTGLTTAGKPRQHLRWSLDKKVKQYRRTAVGVIGPRYRETPHSHLVHDGTKPHKIFLPAGKAIVLKNVTIFGPRYLQHPGSRPNPFMTKAWQSSRAACLNAMEKSLKRFFARREKEDDNLYGGG